jgi:hypothetical protein
MAIPVGQLPKWFSNDMDIGDDEIESTFTKLTEAFSVNTAEKKKFLFLLPTWWTALGSLKSLKRLSLKRINVTVRNMEETYTQVVSLVVMQMETMRITKNNRVAWMALIMLQAWSNIQLQKTLNPVNLGTRRRRRRMARLVVGSGTDMIS